MSNVITASNPIRIASEDRFGRVSFAKAVAKIIRAQGDAGLVVIGVDGEWGAGKSSVLGLAARELVSDRRNREVVISAWRSSTQDQFLSNLSYAMTTALRRDWQSAFIRVALAKMKRQSFPMLVAIFVPLFTVMALIGLPDVQGWTRKITEADPKKLAEGLGLFGLPILSYLFTKAAQPALESVSSLLGKGKTEGIGALERFSYDFDVLGAAQARGSRFLVLVEDLDRCSPGHVSDVMSAIAQLSAHPMAGRLAFLLAYDREILLQSLEIDAAKPNGAGNARASAENYLERVVQLELPLPDAVPSTGEKSSTKIPQLPTPARAALFSALLVLFAIACVGSHEAGLVAKLIMAAICVVFAGETALGFVMRWGDAYEEPDDWSDAVTAAAPWLPKVPRRQIRTLNRARAALLLRPDAGLTSWQAISISAAASRWPTAFGVKSLKASIGHGSLDPKTKYFDAGFVAAYEQMEAANLSVSHFADPEKVFAVVSSFSRERLTSEDNSVL